MKKHVSIAVFVALVLSVTVIYLADYCNAAETVIVSKTPNYYRFVGFSATKTNGMVGPAAMNNACKEKYGQGARMCTTEEILTSWQLPSGSNKYGWINPSQIQISPYPESTTSNKYVAIDSASGFVTYGENPTEASGKLNCSRWTFPLEQDTTGIVLYGQTGSVATSYCSEANYVACCNR